MRRSSFLHLSLLVALFLLAACSESDLNGPPPLSQSPAGSADDLDKSGLGQTTVMTRNVYVGTNLDIILGAEDPSEIPFLAADAFQMLLATNFPERAEALADEIAAKKPHLIGLQEVTTIRIQSPGDMLDGGTILATEVVFDYLQILQDAIARRGLRYDVVGVVQNFDVEVPMITGFDPVSFDDVRATDFNVVLARHDVRTSNTVAENFQAELPLDDLGLSIPNGYIATDALVNGKTFRFVNTHLESYSEYIRSLQAEELAYVLSEEQKPIILLGDFNSPATDGATYQFFTSQGYKDTWLYNLVGNQGTGNTSLMEADLKNETSTLFERIVFIFVRTPGSAGSQSVGPVQAWVVGDQPEDKTVSGLWPSDHAGVVAQLHVPE